MTPFSLLHDASGDIDVSRGLRFTPDLQTFVAQKLDENLSSFMGEWFLDLRLGIPYFQKIIGQKPDLALLDTLFRRAVRGTVGVGSVSAFRTGFERKTRKASVFFTVVLADGSTITETDLNRPFVVDY